MLLTLILQIFAAKFEACRIEEESVHGTLLLNFERRQEHY